MTRAQSELTSEILLVAVVVVSVSIFGFAYLDTVGVDQPTLTELGEVSDEPDYIEIGHLGGQSLTNESIRIIVSDETTSTTVSFDDGTIVSGSADDRFDPGDVWRWDGFAETPLTGTDLEVLVATSDRILFRTSTSVSEYLLLSDPSVDSLAKDTAGQSQTFRVTVDGSLSSAENIRINLSQAAPAVDYSSATVTSTSPDTTATVEAGPRITQEPTTRLSTGTELTVTLDNVDVGTTTVDSVPVTFRRTDTNATVSARLLLFESGSVTATGTTDGPIYATGDIIVDFDALVEGEVIAGGSVELRDRAEVTNDIEATTDVTVGFDGIVGGNITSENTVTLRDRADIAGSVASDGSATFGSETVVDGPVDIGGALSVTTDATLGDDVSADGSLSLGSGTNAAGDVSAGGSVTLGNDVDIGGSLTSGGSVTAGDRTEVTGDLEAVSDVDFATDGVIGGMITTDGAVSLGDRTEVTGDVDADSLSCGNNVVINGQSCADYIAANY